MSDRVARIAGLIVAGAYASLIVWLHVQQPATTAQVTGGLASFVHAYRIDSQAFEDGLRFFRADNFAAARSAFDRADPAQRDPRTQFYIAYSDYREGWGRLRDDPVLFQRGLDAVTRAMAAAPNGGVRVDDPNLAMHTGDELKAELERGIAHPFHPANVFEGRK